MLHARQHDLVSPRHTRPAPWVRTGLAVLMSPVFWHIVLQGLNAPNLPAADVSNVVHTEKDGTTVISSVLPQFRREWKLPSCLTRTWACYVERGPLISQQQKCGDGGIQSIREGFADD